MAQPSNTTNNINIFSDLSIQSTAHKEVETVSERVPKRGAPDQRKDEVKKAKIDYHSTAERISSVAPKFVSAAEIAATNIRLNIQAMPEISDKELLEMAIKFEMEHPE